MRACETLDEVVTEMDNHAPFDLRKATLDDVPQLIRLHRVAIRELGGSAYTADQIDSFLLHVPTLDDALIADRTYFVAMAEGTVVGAGGWSFRVPGYAHTIDTSPASAAERTAVIRAMYTHPDWARRGIGRAILDAAEAEAAAAGYRRIELHALLPGVPLYRACGYTPIGRCQAQLADGVTLPVVHMHKRVDARPAGRRGRPDPGTGWGRAA
jgi:GNAT superfamily N-acetyltransferase